MGFWSKLKQGLQVATALAPALPIPDNAKKVIAGAGKIEQDVEDVVHAVKPPKTAA